MAIENTKPPRSVQQPRVVDVSRPGQALAVEIDAAEAAELLLSIATLLAEEDRDTYELEAARIDELLAAVPPELLRDTAELLPERQRRSCSDWSTRRRSRARPRLSSTTSPRPIPSRSASTCSATTAVITWPSRRRSGARRRETPGRSVRCSTRTRSTSIAEKCAKAEAVLGTDPAEGKRALLEVLTGWYEHVLPQLVPADPTLAGARRGGEARAREVGSSRAGRRAAGTRHPVDTGAPDRPRRALPCLLAAPLGLHERVQAREDLLLPDHARPRAGDPGDPAELVRIYKALGDASRLKLLRRLQDRADLAHGRGQGDRPREVDDAPPPRAPAPGRLRADPGGRRHLQAPPRPAAGARSAARELPRRLSPQARSGRARHRPPLRRPAGTRRARRASSSTTSRASRTSGPRSGSATSRPGCSTPSTASTSSPGTSSRTATRSRSSRRSAAARSASSKARSTSPRCCARSRIPRPARSRASSAPCAAAPASRDVLHLDYEAYEEMAEPMLAQPRRRADRAPRALRGRRPPPARPRRDRRGERRHRRLRPASLGRARRLPRGDRDAEDVDPALEERGVRGRRGMDRARIVSAAGPGRAGSFAACSTGSSASLVVRSAGLRSSSPSSSRSPPTRSGSTAGGSGSASSS